jgi:hypothetical protein
MIIIGNSFGKKINYGNYILPGILIGAYHFIWGFYNGRIEEGGYNFILLNNRWFQSVAIIFLIYNTTFDKKFINNTIRILKATVIISFIVILIQTLLDVRFFTPVYFDQYHVFGKVIEDRRESIYTFLWHETDYSFMPIMCILLAYLFRNSKTYFPYLFFGSIIAIASNSRTTMLAYFTATLPLILNNKDRFTRIIKYAGFSVIGIILILLSMVLIGYDLQSWFIDRLGSGSYITRIGAFSVVINGLQYIENIWLGLGSKDNAGILNYLLKQLWGGTQIHNAYLAHFVYYGLIGLSLLCWFYYSLITKLFSTARKTKFYGSIISFIILIQVQMTTIPFSGIFAYGLLFCFVFDKYYSDISKYNRRFA